MIVTIMLTVLTLRVVSHAPVEKDILVLEWIVKVFNIGQCTVTIVHTKYYADIVLDVNECASSASNDCHPDASCNNTVGSYDCACLSGFEGNGTFCTGNFKKCYTTLLDLNSNSHRH